MLQTRINAIDWGFLGFLVANAPYLKRVYRNRKNIVKSLPRIVKRCAIKGLGSASAFFGLTCFGADVYAVLYYPRPSAGFLIGTSLGIMLVGLLGVILLALAVLAVAPRSRLAGLVRIHISRRAKPTRTRHSFPGSCCFGL